MQDCAQEGTADTAEAQLGGIVTVTHDEDPPLGALVVVEELVVGDDAGAVLDVLTAALVEVVGGVVDDAT